MEHNHITAAHQRPNYRLETPAPLLYTLAAGLGSGIVGVILTLFSPATQRLLAVILLGAGLLAVGLTTLVTRVLGSGARLAARRKLMNAVVWRGDETVLDVGCGNGFLLVEAAKRLTTGTATGIDIWLENSGGQSVAVVRQNARLEGVDDRIEVQNVDARQMPFEDEMFDVIMSSLALHHMGSDAPRAQTVAEMVRVLKPGGTILLYDFFPMINQAAGIMRQQGAMQTRRLGGVALVVLAGGKPGR